MMPCVCFHRILFRLFFLFTCLLGFRSSVLCNEKGFDQPPNILLVIADDWGAHASAYKTPWVQTPAFDRVAREGLLFHHAYTPNAKCAPSRSILLTGRHSWQLEEAGNHLSFFPAKFKCWPEVLNEKGWQVGLTGKGWGPGIAKSTDGTDRKLIGKPFNRKTVRPPAKGIAANDYAANFADFLDQAEATKPWCFWVGFQEPHRPYELGIGESKAGKKLADVDRVPAYWPDDSVTRRDMLDYGAEVEYLDSHLTRILNELDQRDLASNTLVIVTSDHGMPFPRCKGYAYHDSNHVPLAIRWPQGITQPKREIQDFVDFTDIAPTLLDIAGIDIATSGMAPVAGRSWRPLFASEKDGLVDAERTFSLVGRERNDVGRPGDVGYPIRGIVTERYLYLHNFEPSRWPAGNPETGYLDTDGSPTKTAILERGRSNRSDSFWQLCFGLRPEEELYDLQSDPDCVRNLALIPDARSVLTSLREQMERKLIEQGDPRMRGEGDVFDRYPVTSGAGFYDQWKRGEKVSAGWVEPSDFEPAIKK